MTTVTFHKTKDGVIKGFQSKGHAGYANAGEDIVCASISILVINTINALEQLTEHGFQVEADDKKGVITCSFPGEPSHDATLLLQAMELGLTEISKQYSNFCRLRTKEV